MSGVLDLLFNVVARKKLGRCENVRVEAFTKNLAGNLNPSKIKACADALHQIGNFWEGTPLTIRRALRRFVMVLRIPCPALHLLMLQSAAATFYGPQ